MNSKYLSLYLFLGIELVTFLLIGFSSHFDWVIIKRFCIIVAIAYWILIYLIVSDDSTTEDTRSYDVNKYYQAIAYHKSIGDKIIYSNKNTGTITVKHSNGETESFSVYQGYNSHYKGTHFK